MVSLLEPPFLRLATARSGFLVRRVRLRRTNGCTPVGAPWAHPTIEKTDAAVILAQARIHLDVRQASPTDAAPSSRLSNPSTTARPSHTRSAAAAAGPRGGRD